MQNERLELTRLAASRAGRRGFVAGAAGLGLAALAPRHAAAQAAEPAAEAVAPAAINDADILNFALNLEYLEAEFYLRAAFGTGLTSGQTSGQGSRGDVTGGRKVSFKSAAIREYAEEIADDERNHVLFLRSALGSAAVARPAIDLRDSFTTAARAAGLISGSQTFDPFANEDAFLLGAFIFEDVGVTAYKGAAALIDDKGTLEAAAGLLAVEAYHAGLVRTVLFSRGLFQQALKISNARDSLDGSGDRDQGIGTKSNGNIVPTDGNGLAFSRTTDQVLSIVYLGGQASDFGFFPNRLNGDIK
jgi:Ferritin-like domain